MSDAAFATIALDTFEESPASPVVEDDFRGIRIAMPSRVAVADLERIPVCGTWALSHDRLERYGPVVDDLVFLVRDRDTHQSYTGNFRMHEDPGDPADPEPAGPDADGEDSPEIAPDEITSKGWFNYNLGRVWKAPLRPARYRMVVVLDDLESNAVDFEVTR